jgi:hypothetical protein
MRIFKPKKPKSKKKIKRTKNSFKHNYVDYGTFTYSEKPEVSATPKIKVKRKPKFQPSIIEDRLASYFKKYNVAFEPQYIFEDCINPKTGAKLIFDFYIPSHNTLIEYDGEQHFKSIRIDGVKTDIESQKYRDEIKNKFCKQKGINLIRLNKTHIEGFDGFVFRNFVKE